MRTLFLFLLLAAATPARAQAPSDGPPRTDMATPTPAAAVTASWYEAFSTLATLATSLDEYASTPADQQDDARQSLALSAAFAAGGITETTRFSVSLGEPEASRAAAGVLLQEGLGLSYALSRVANEATVGREDGRTPDWHAHAATIREMTAQIRVTLATLGIDPN